MLVVADSGGNAGNPVMLVIQAIPGNTRNPHNAGNLGNAGNPYNVDNPGDVCNPDNAGYASNLVIEVMLII